MREKKDGNLLHTPLIGLEYSGKSSILHALRHEHVGAYGSFRSLFTLTNHSNAYKVVVRFNSLQNEFRGFKTDIMAEKTRNLLKKHIGNIDVFIPAMCVLVDRETGSIQPELITVPLSNVKDDAVETKLFFLDVSPDSLMSFAPQVYRSSKIAERAVAEFDILKRELSSRFPSFVLNGNRPRNQLSQIAEDMQQLVFHMKNPTKER